MNQFGFNGFGGFHMFDILFAIIPIIVLLGFVFVFGSIIYRGFSVLKDKSKPIIPARAKVVSKRTHVGGSRRGHGHYGNHQHIGDVSLGHGQHTRTEYYATFELENSERIEFLIPRDKVGYLVEGDSGILSFQGNLFVKFERL